MIPATAHQLLIIGAGPTGLAAAKALREKGIPYAQVEATDHVGGNWAHGVYETAHIISSRKTTEYPDYPMPESYPDFPSAAQMCAYYNDFADTFELREFIRFETRVEAVRYRADERWDVTLDDGTTEIYKGVLVCNGHHWSRSFPAWTHDYTGALLHSKDYKSPDQLKGKRVLVLGGGNSGCDLISEAARVGTEAHWSLRRGYWFMPKTFFGMPSIELMQPWMPLAAQRVLIKALLRITVGPFSKYGLPEPDHKIFEAHPTISTEVFHYLKHGKIEPLPDVERAEGDVIVFTDGRRERYDLVVCATGYNLSFPMLPEGMVPIHGKIARLYGGVLRPDYRHLYVVGTVQARYGVGPLLRPYALLIADFARFQDGLSVPMGTFLKAMGDKPPQTHLVDPFDAMRRMAVARRALPLLRKRAKRMGMTGGPPPFEAGSGGERGQSLGALGTVR